MGTYIIAEIGQNHNGSKRIAAELIDVASQEIIHEGEKLKKANAVKFQIRDLDYELNEDSYLKEYKSVNAFADTYGKHREYLEIPIEEYKDLAEEARDKGLDVVVTVCSPTIIEKIKKIIKPDAWKVASRDLGNVPLLEAINEVDPKKVILSSGMHQLADIEEAVYRLVLPEIIGILHCISVYPTKYEDLNLRGMEQIKENFKSYNGTTFKIGFSDHTAGVLAPSVAVALGAQIIEKHITLDHSMKGSDHFGSMNREGWFRVVRDIRNTEKAISLCQRLNDGIKNPEEQKTWNKIGRVACYKNNINKGQYLEIEDVIMLSPPSNGHLTGISWEDAYKFNNKPLQKDVKENEMIIPELHFPFVSKYYK